MSQPEPTNAVLRRLIATTRSRIRAKEEGIKAETERKELHLARGDTYFDSVLQREDGAVTALGDMVRALENELQSADPAPVVLHRLISWAHSRIHAGEEEIQAEVARKNLNVGRGDTYSDPVIQCKEGAMLVFNEMIQILEGEVNALDHNATDV